MDEINFIKQLKEKIDLTLKNFENKLSQVRATGAHPSLVSNLLVNYYDVPTPLQQIANIQAPDATLLIISPFDKASSMEILKTISNSALGLSGVDEGEKIRIVVPPLTDEKRHFFVKQVKELTEDAKISIRTIRHDANKKILNLKLSKNEEELRLDEIQKEIDKANNKILEFFKLKEEELTKI